MHMTITEIPDVLNTLIDENDNLTDDGHEMLFEMELNGDFI